MSAQHEGSLAQLLQQVDNAETSLSREQTKVRVTQNKRGPNVHNIGDRGVAGIGTVYPINAPVDDRGTVADASIDIAIPSPRHHYVKMSLNNANPTINLINLIVGLTSTFTLDLTNTIALSSLTFSPALSNAPTIDLGISARNILHIVAHRTASETRYEVISGAGGGGVSFPIIPPVDDRGNVNTTQNINLSLTTAHVTTMTLTGNISITFSNFPATGNNIEWEVEIKQDGTGGHTVTWPAAVTPIPVIDTTAGVTTIVVLRTNDNGTIIRTLLAPAGIDLSQWATFTAVNDIDYGTFDGKNIDRLRFVSDSGAPASAGDPSIYLDGVSNMVFNIADQKQYFWTMNDESRLQLDQEGVNEDTALVIQTPIAHPSAIPISRLFRDDPTPTNGDEFARIEVTASDAASSGGAKINTQVYNRIIFTYENVVDGREASSINFFSSFDTGAATQLKSFLGINNVNSNEIDAFVDLNMNDHNINTVTNIIGRDDGTQFQIIFDGAEDSDTAITNDAAVLDRINVFANNVNGWIWTWDAGVSKVVSGIPGGVAAALVVSDHAVHFGAMTIPPDADVSNDTGAVFFDTSTDPGILKIKKKSTVGVVSTVNLEAGGAVQDKIEEGDSKVEVIDTGTGQVDVFVDGATAKFRFLATGFSPVVAGGVNLGTASLPWEKLSIKDIEIETGGTLTTTKNNLVATATGIRYNVPTNDFHTFEIAGVETVIFDEDEIRFRGGRAHKIVAGNTALQLITENQTDDLQIFTGAARSNVTVLIEDLKTSWFTDDTDTVAYALQIIQNNTTPAAFRTIANIDLIAENTISIDTIYARISASSQVVTSGIEDGLLQLGIVSGGTLLAAIDMEGSGSSGANDAKIGFFGETPVVQQQLDAAPTTTEISTALRNLGLTKL